jgi:hypothetical protein
MPVMPKATAPKWSLKNGILKDLVTLIIAPPHKAGSDERHEIIIDHINLIASTPLKTFNSIALWMHPTEVENSPIWSAASRANLGIVADTMQAAWRHYKGNKENYQKYVQQLYNLRKVRIFRLDDINTLDKDVLKALIEPIHDLANTKVIASTSVSQYALGSRFALNNQVALELQLYRHGESTSNVHTFVRDRGMTVGAFECFRDEKGRLTSPREIRDMGAHLINSDVPNVSVYGIDENTTYLAPKGEDDDNEKAKITDTWFSLSEMLNNLWTVRKG